MAWPWSNQGIASPNLNVSQDQQQYLSGTDWRSQMQPMNVGWSNTGQVPNTLQQDMANVTSNTSQAEFDEGDDGTYNEMRGIHFKDQPIEKWRNRQNHPMKGLLDQNFNYRALNQGTNEATQNWLNKNQGDGIMSTDQAQKKPFINWDAFPSPMNILRSFKDSPQEKFNREYFSTYTGGPMEGRISEHPGSNVFGNMNVTSIFGGLDTGGQKRIDRLSRAIAKMEGPGGDATKGKWSRKYEEDREEYDRRLNALRERKILFSGQLKKYNADLIAKGIKSKSGDAPAIKKVVTSSVPQGEYRERAINRPDPSFSDPSTTGFMGPGGVHYAQGGRAGYAFGDRVEQETDFIEGPQGGEEFQETVVEGQEQPSREQLEALAMEIFQLPLEELDEQQLLVVYQEAMQGQPMQESVQEDEVQFAAQGGLAGLL